MMLEKHIYVYYKNTYMTSYVVDFDMNNNTIIINGTSARSSTPVKMKNLGFGFVTENRKEEVLEITEEEWQVLLGLKVPEDAFFRETLF